MSPPAFHTDQPSASSGAGAKRAAAPISAGAFAFSLGGGTPKRAKVDRSGQVATPLRPPSLTPGRRTINSPLPPLNLERPQTPQVGSSLITPKKTYRPLDAFPSPFSITPKSANTGTSQHRPLQSLLDESSPFRPKQELASSAYGDKLVRLGDLARGKIEQIPRELIKREDEGIGVSPRKVKGAKWSGKGPMPTSMQLANLLQTTNSSLLLFYTSLQRILYVPSRSAQSVKKPGPVLPPTTPLQHLRTAPLVLRVKALAGKRTHSGTMFVCEVSSFKKADTDVSAMMDRLKRAGSGEGDEMEPVRVVLVIQSTPHECPRVGLDPKVIVGKMDEGTNRAWEIGVWTPFFNVPVTAAESDVSGHRSLSILPAAVDAGAPQPERSGHPKEELQNKPPPPTQYIFASRFLLAEVAAT